MENRCLVGSVDQGTSSTRFLVGLYYTFTIIVANSLIPLTASWADHCLMIDLWMKELLFSSLCRYLTAKLQKSSLFTRSKSSSFIRIKGEHYPVVLPPRSISKISGWAMQLGWYAVSLHVFFQMVWRRPWRDINICLYLYRQSHWEFDKAQHITIKHKR